MSAVPTQRRRIGPLARSAAHATLADDATVWQGAVAGRPGLALAQWCQQTASARCSGTTGCSFEVHGKSCCSDLLPHGLQLQSARRWPASRWKAGNTGESQAMCAGQRSDYAAASAASAALSSAAAPRATVQPPPSQLQLNKQRVVTAAHSYLPLGVSRIPRALRNLASVRPS